MTTKPLHSSGKACDTSSECALFESRPRERRF